jgi:hypothetical protein
MVPKYTVRSVKDDSRLFCLTVTNEVANVKTISVDRSIDRFGTCEVNDAYLSVTGSFLALEQNPEDPDGLIVIDSSLQVIFLSEKSDDNRMTVSKQIDIESLLPDFNRAYD